MKKKCCGENEKPDGHADHTGVLNRVSRALGQLQGVHRMIEEQRYCPDIITQIAAIKTALSSLQSVVLKGHLEQCVKEAFDSGKKSEREAKISELTELFKKL